MKVQRSRSLRNRFWNQNKLYYINGAFVHKIKEFKTFFNVENLKAQIIKY